MAGGIIDLLRRYHVLNLKGYAIESIWKFLIYSEMALAAEAIVKNRISGQIQDSEKDLIAILDQNAEMLRQDFSVRLERCIQALLTKAAHVEPESIEKNRVAVSEALHSGVLRKLREVLTGALHEKRRIAILVDNLDKAWEKQSDIEQLSEFLLGLLGATNRISSDFRGVGPTRQTLNVSLAVFVRADIFYRVIATAREPDKIVYSKLSWNDDEMLIRVIEERFATLGSHPTEVWSKYFCNSVQNVPTREYFVSRVLKRPRDLIFFIKAAITTAVNRRHALVEERDILDAEKQYSQFAVDSILVEDGVTIQQLENALYEFVGVSSILDDNQVRSLLSSAGIQEHKLPDVVKHLCDLTFLGVEVAPGVFRFADDQAENHKNSILAHRLATSRPGPARYKVNTAFWAFLEVKPVYSC